MQRFFILYPRLIRANVRHVRSQGDLDEALRLVYADAKFHDWGIPADDLRRAVAPRLPMTAGDFFDALVARYDGGEPPGAWGIKKGSYAPYHAAIREIYPDAKFVCLFRDGRAVLASKKRSFHSYSGRPYACTAVGAAMHWRERTSLMLRIAEAYPGATRVHFEDLIRDTGPVVRKIADHLGLRPRAADGGKGFCVPERYGQELHKNIDRPALTERIDSWKRELTTREILDFESVAGEEMKRAGYQTVSDEKRLRSLANRMRIGGKRLVEKFRGRR
jgi:hypothetical protein